MNKVSYSKPWLSIEDQLRKLEGRGLVVADRELTLRRLRYINYYRFSGYALKFQTVDVVSGDRVFKDKVSFDDIWGLYLFDRSLRDLCAEALEMIEISLRTSITHNFSKSYGPFGHTNVSNFDISFSRPRPSASSRTNIRIPFRDWKNTLLNETNRSNELFVKHFERTYSEYPDLPIWVVSEICSFGTLSRMYSNMKNGDQARVASEYGLQYLVLESWMHALTYARNVCAHHARLWDKTMQITPVVPSRKLWNGLQGRERTLFMVVLMVNWMMSHDSIDIADHEDWKRRFELLMDSFDRDYPQLFPFTGFTKDWKKNPLWWQF